MTQRPREEPEQTGLAKFSPVHDRQTVPLFGPMTLLHDCPFFVKPKRKNTVSPGFGVFISDCSHAMYNLD